MTKLRTSKGKTVMTESERYESLRHCKWVDEVIPDAPWVTQDFLDKHNIDFVAHDSLPYADTSGAGKDVYEFEKRLRVNMRLKKLQEKVKEHHEKGTAIRVQERLMGPQTRGASLLLENSELNLDDLEEYYDYYSDDEEYYDEDGSSQEEKM